MLQAGRLAIAAKCRLNPLRCIPTVLGTLLFITLSLTVYRFFRKLPGRDIYIARESACLDCAIYNPQLGTCGTPGETWRDPATGRLETFGCLCVVAVKSLLHVDCWLWLKTNGHAGWPNHLNATFYGRN